MVKATGAEVNSFSLPSISMLLKELLKWFHSEEKDTETICNPVNLPLKRPNRKLVPQVNVSPGDLEICQRHATENTSGYHGNSCILA